MATYFVSNTALGALLGKRQGQGVAVPAETKSVTWLDCAEIDSDSVGAALRQARSAQSFKGFFLPAAESMGRYGAEAPTATAVETGRTALVGVRACELRAQAYFDQVMLGGDFDDPPYQARRAAMTLVSCDCVDCAETCFCTLVGGRPFATDGFDVNLTPVDGGFVVEAATDAGKAWLGDAQLAEASAQQISARDAVRERMVERLEQQNAPFMFSATDDSPPALPDDAAGSWQQFAADCVECAACTNICPTCHCFYLYDQALGPEAFERVRTWDSCLLSTYHRMAGVGGMKGTPRPNLSSRLANRVLHKFTYSPQQYERLGCVGCGRCIDACLGAIDIRQVVQELGS